MAKKSKSAHTVNANNMQASILHQRRGKQAKHPLGDPTFQTRKGLVKTINDPRKYQHFGLVITIKIIFIALMALYVGFAWQASPVVISPLKVGIAALLAFLAYLEPIALVLKFYYLVVAIVVILSIFVLMSPAVLATILVITCLIFIAGFAYTLQQIKRLQQQQQLK